MLKQYYWLTKPGIIYGNLMYLLAGFFFASVMTQGFDGWLLASTAIGTSLVIASGCVFNNYTDRGVDKKMARTKKRALAKGSIPAAYALAYGAALGAVGFVVLAAFTNWLVVCIGIVGIVDYVFLYAYCKRTSVHGTLVGSISGAMPPVAGYCAVTGEFDLGALLLFLLLVAWQMPHFYAIAMYRRNDYAAAGIPVLPVVKGVRRTKIEIAAYVIVFTATALLMTAFGYTGIVYLLIMAAVGLVWLYKAFTGFVAADDVQWARGMFGFSLVITLAVSLLLPLGAWLP
ncbi:MAG TPA: heme o synthase [Candidatus Saccharimonadales bacterium]|nr:heme o synthase [Candidatus Saccharimonadales bacterium]